MKRTKTGAGRSLPGMEDVFEVPEAVQTAADEFTKALREKNKATVKHKEKMDALIDVMNEHNVEWVWIDEGQKLVHFTLEGKVKIETPRKEDN